MKLTNNTDPMECWTFISYDEYNSYGVGFDARSKFPWSDDEWGKNIFMVRVDNSFFVYVKGT